MDFLTSHRAQRHACTYKTLFFSLFIMLSSFNVHVHAQEWGPATIYETIKMNSPLPDNIDVNASNASNINALHLAIADGNLDAVKVLVDAGADVNSGRLPPESKKFDGVIEPIFDTWQTLLNRTAFFWKTQEIRYLSGNLYGVTQLEKEIIAHLSKGGPDTFSYQLSAGILCPLYASIKSKEQKKLAFMQKRVHNIFPIPVELPLTIAIVNGYQDIADYLIANGADVNEQSATRTTPLMAAIVYHQQDSDASLAIMQKLIDAGVDVNQQDPFWQLRDTFGVFRFKSYIEPALRYHMHDVVEFLLTHGFDIQQATLTQAQRQHVDTLLYSSIQPLKIEKNTKTKRDKQPPQARLVNQKSKPVHHTALSRKSAMNRFLTRTLATCSSTLPK